MILESDEHTQIAKKKKKKKKKKKNPADVSSFQGQTS